MMLRRSNRPPLSFNEIRSGARQFVADWCDLSRARESGEAQTFWNQFFHIYGMRREDVAVFEKRAKRIGRRGGFIDLFWSGKLLVEHKSLGADLDAAMQQAMDYLHDKVGSDEMPRYVVACDFARFVLCDLRADTTETIALADLPDKAHLFSFIAGYEKQEFRREAEVNIAAAELMAGVYDALGAAGYQGESASIFLVRVLFCLFAEDTGIFESGLFTSFIRNRTASDGTDLGGKLNHLFEILDRPANKRMATLDEHLACFPYIDGALFRERIDTANFDSALREKILHACDFNWAQVSPAVFGSLFQSAMDQKTRRREGRHYTAEDNILKIVEPLFMDKLHAKFAAAKTTKSRARLLAFHNELAGLKFLDPACGCGNFLIVAYRELRRLELALLRQLHPGKRALNLNMAALSRIDVDSFYGIEIDPFSTRIAEVALWLTDHQMNRELSAEFGNEYQRIPLKKSPHIHCTNALTTDWGGIVAPSKLSYILGNPPFVGQAYRTAEQRREMTELFNGARGAGNLDYVAAWYLCAARYIRNTDITCAFVSTNSIAQGEQVAPLWKLLYAEGARIHFAHRTFAWKSEARGMAHVHVVIIGFGAKDAAQKFIYEYDTPKSEPHKTAAANINGYLIDAADILVEGRNKPLSPAPQMDRGSGPLDNGNFLFTLAEKREFLRREPAAKKFFRRILGSREFINDIERWCLWLENAEPKELRQMPAVMERVEKVRSYRASSIRKQTLAAAATPSVFAEIRQPKRNYLLVPRVSSEHRRYIPVGFMPARIIASDRALAVPDAEHYEFGVITSAMHMAWMRAVGGRLKWDYSYSHKVVYNAFPWPSPTVKQREKIAACAGNVLTARKKYPQSSLADLYDPKTMPAELSRAHRELDKAVDRAYRSAPFASERARLEFLFAEYQKLAHPAIPPEKRRRKPKRRA
ncbi:MAG: class I SAM-dependent DNA methyltransferase [Gammaproteobacteria bacterium]